MDVWLSRKPQAACFLFTVKRASGMKLVLIILSLCVFLHPPDGPGAESRPPSHPRTPSHRQEEARLLQRLPTEVQLTGEEVFF